MITKLAPPLWLLVAGWFAQGGLIPATTAAGGPVHGDTVRVVSPTGDAVTDRMSILAALAQVEPGGTVLFAPGTYRTGGSIQVAVPDVTLVGHASGTTLRGCDPVELADYENASRRCGGLELVAGRQTVRSIVFEHMSWASIQIVPARAEGQTRRSNSIEGGHLIEGNTFRDSDSFNVIGEAAAPVLIRENTFINTYHAVAISGSNVHVLDNVITAIDPARIPFGRADIAIGAAQFEREGPRCADNVIAGNRIEGHTEGIAVAVFAPGASCRGNVIRNNTIVVSRGNLAAPERAFYARAGDPDAPFIGVPLRLLNYVEACRTLGGDFFPVCPPLDDGSEDAGIVADNTIEGNRIAGAEGLAVEVLYASDNRILGNTITRTVEWYRFPQGLLRHPPQWKESNGAAIWISSGSNRNEIVGNAFEDIAGPAVVLEGSLNRVQSLNVTDIVRDAGTGNRVIRPDDR